MEWDLRVLSPNEVQLVESIVYTMTDLDRVGSHGFTVVASDSSA